MEHSEEGTYEITLQASGLIPGSPVSERATYTFNGVPEPASALFLGCGALALLGRRRRAQRARAQRIAMAVV